MARTVRTAAFEISEVRAYADVLLARFRCLGVMLRGGRVLDGL
jgi:hypothetical protein